MNAALIGAACATTLVMFLGFVKTIGDKPLKHLSAAIAAALVLFIGAVLGKQTAWVIS